MSSGTCFLGLRFALGLDALKQFLHLKDMIEGIISKELEHRHASQLMAYPVGQLFFDLVMSLFYLMQCGLRIADLKKTQIKTGLEQVRSDLDRRDRHHSPLDHRQTQSLKDAIHLFVEQAGDLLLSFSFFHII